MNRMAFKINETITNEDRVRAVLPEVAYIEKLKEMGEALFIDNVLIDAPQLIERRFICDTLHCMRRTGKHGHCKGSCCTDLEVNITPNEVLQMRRLAKKYLASSAAAPESPEYAVAKRVMEGDGWMDQNYRGEPTITHSKKNVCSLGHVDGEGRLLCAVNAMAAALGDPIAKWKLITCYVFPLHYIEYEEGRYLLTVLCRENHESLDAAPDIGRLRCINRPPKDAPPAYESLRGEIECLFGARFYTRLAEAAKRWESELLD
jgi:hypothetical protein